MLENYHAKYETPFAILGIFGVDPSVNEDGKETVYSFDIPRQAVNAGVVVTRPAIKIDASIRELFSSNAPIHPWFLGSLDENDVLVAVTTISFDIAALEIFLPLISGGKLVLASRDEAIDGSLLLQKIRSSRATTLQATPATWKLMLEAGWEAESRVVKRSGVWTIRQTLEALDGLRALLVGARHRVAEVHEDLGDARHPDAADPDEVDVAVTLIHGRPARCSGARRWRASSRAAPSRRRRGMAAAGPSSAASR